MPAGFSVMLALGIGAEEPHPTSPETSGLVIGKNAIYVAEQKPSKTVTVAAVRLNQPGFVVIHEDAAGVPGAVLGASVLLPVGDVKNIPPLPLSRETKDGDMIYAMLHIDDGDGIFDLIRDAPARDPIGESPVTMIIHVSAKATESPDAVNW